MEKSESLKNIGKALSLFHIKMGKLGVDSRNPFFNSKYCSLSNILENIATPLQESGLIFSQFPINDGGLCTILIHGESGEFIESEYRLPPMKNDPQGVGSAITYARRYALAAILGLNIDPDDDGNAASGNTTKPAKSQPEQKQPETKQEEKPWLNEDSDVYNKIVTRLKEKTTTLDAIAQHFKLSKNVRASLQTIINSVAYTDN